MKHQMDKLPRRNLLGMFIAAGAAAACGLTVAPRTEAKEAAPEPTPRAAPVEAGQAAETLESELKPDRVYFVRRRYVRRRIYFVRPRRIYYYRRPRRIYFIRRRPRYRVIRFYRRRW